MEVLAHLIPHLSLHPKYKTTFILDLTRVIIHEGANFNPGKYEQFSRELLNHTQDSEYKSSNKKASHYFTLIDTKIASRRWVISQIKERFESL